MRAECEFYIFRFRPFFEFSNKSAYDLWCARKRKILLLEISNPKVPVAFGRMNHRRFACLPIGANAMLIYFSPLLEEMMCILRLSLIVNADHLTLFAQMPIYPIFLDRNSSRSLIAMRSCFCESRSRTVTVSRSSGPFSPRVSKSMVTPKGVPASSCLA